jgi:hypothetical protein
LSHVTRRGFTQRGALVAALLALGACVEWRPEAVPASSSRAADRLPSETRIVTGDGRELLLRDPYVQDDSLFGVVLGVRGGDREVVGVALTEIRFLEARRPSVGRSAALAAGILGGVIVVLNVLYGNGS